MDFYHLLKAWVHRQLKLLKNLSNQYNQKFIDSAKKSTTDPIKTASKKKFKRQ